jgi:hypothetical protein
MRTALDASPGRGAVDTVIEDPFEQAVAQGYLQPGHRHTQAFDKTPSKKSVHEPKQHCFSDTIRTMNNGDTILLVQIDRVRIETKESYHVYLTDAQRT